jgi:membrane protein implicated in regulation of membrane protease activity
MRFSAIHYVAFALAGIIMVFAFLAASVAVASGLAALLLGAGLVWLGWRVVRHRLSQTRDTTA